MKTMKLDILIGKTFTINDPAIEYVCVGFAQNDTFIIFGAQNNTLDNRSSIKSFKLTEAKLKGVFPPS